jgi:hypothetical protein
MWLYGQGRYEFAVIGLQTALEVYLELTVVGLVKWREVGSLGDAIVDKLVRNYRFDDGRFQALWYGLTGDDGRKLKTEDWWDAYTNHVDLRHRVVHRGYMPTQLETERSREGTLGAMRYVQTTETRVGVEIGAIWEVGTARPAGRLPKHDRPTAD